MTNIIIDAIRNGRSLKIFYPPGERTIEPHTLGKGSSCQLLLRAYQAEGASASGEPEHWKLFRVDRIRFVADGGAPAFAPRPGYKRGDMVMKGGIIEEV